MSFNFLSLKLYLQWERHVGGRHGAPLQKLLKLLWPLLWIFVGLYPLNIFWETCISWSISGIGFEYWMVGGGWFRWSSSMSEIHFSTTFNFRIYNNKMGADFDTIYWWQITQCPCWLLFLKCRLILDKNIRSWVLVKINNKWRLKKTFVLITDSSIVMTIICLNLIIFLQKWDSKKHWKIIAETFAWAAWSLMLNIQ